MHKITYGNFETMIRQQTNPLQLNNSQVKKISSYKNTFL